MVTRVKWRGAASRRHGAGREAAGIPGTAGGNPGAARRAIRCPHAARFRDRIG